VDYGTVSTIGGVNHLVISQVYGGGGNSGATYTHDFIEIFNPTNATVNLSNWTVQYASSTSSSWTSRSLVGSIAPGKYYLFQQASNAAVGAALPTPDATGSISMAAGAGKVALVNNSFILTGQCPTGVSIVDFVGYGSGTDCSETAVTGTISATTAAIRTNGGCTDVNNNSTDFAVATPTPRNSASPANYCPGSPETICSGTVPSPMSAIGASGGSGTFTYQWYYQQPPVSCPSGTNTTGWTPLTMAEGTGFNTATFMPTAAVTADITYAVLVTADGTPACPPPTWATNCRQVIVNNVTGGIVEGDRSLCTPADPVAFTQSVAATGDATPTFVWQSSTTSCMAGFADIVPAETGTTYDPPAGLTTTTYYRRVATSLFNGVTCTANSNCITVTITQPPSASISYTSNPYCQNAGTATVTQTGTSGGTYGSSPAGLSINAATGAVTLGTSTPGTYTVTYTIAASGGCLLYSTSTIITVNPNPIGSAPPQTICSGTTTSVALSSTVTGTTYTWTAMIHTTPTGGTITGFSDCNADCGMTIAQTLTNTGTSVGVIRYTVTPTYANAGVSCNGATFTVDITIRSAMVASFVPTNVGCNGASTGVIDLTVTGGSPGYTYAWSNGSTDQDLSGIAAGTYTVTVSDANSCTNTASATITEPTAIALSTTQTNVACNGDSNGSIDLSPSGGTGGYTYLWSNGPTDQDLSGIAAGTYTVTVTDANNCTNTTSATIVSINPTPDITTSLPNLVVSSGTNIAEIILGGSVPNTIYKWSNNNTTIGLAAMGEGTIPTFVATNALFTPAIATITVI